MACQCMARRLACFGRARLLQPRTNILYTASAPISIWVPDKEKPRVTLETWKTAYKNLRPELRKFKQEVVEKFRMDIPPPREHSDYEYLWKFNGESTLQDWIVTADSDNSDGKSTARLTTSKGNKAHFHGYLCLDVPKDGISKRAGYVNMRSPHKMKSFRRKIPYDWTRYTHLVMRVRGDGRPYQINLLMDHFFDINWYDMFNFVLFTRGGPYWQTAKIPFSKFYRSSHGRVQDKQEAALLGRVASLGVALMDGSEGAFSLEIDYIGLLYDENHTETFAYELYQANPRFVGT